jgi:UDP-N-acetylglucosamine:LPS N-acetylglucosamine transferase
VTNFVKRFQFVYFDAGGGHRAAATALKAVIDQQGDHPWEITLVNLQEVLHSLDIFRKVTGIRLEDIYNLMLAKGWTLGAAQGLRFMHGVIRLYHGATVRQLARYWAETKPDLVVSLVPNFNRAMFEGLSTASPQTPYVTILTDFADYPPHFWVERQNQYFICGTSKAVEQAVSLGHSADRVFATSGMILRPDFYEPLNIDRAAEIQRLGLDPAKPTALVLFGGQGSNVMLDIAAQLSETQLILICGKNESLARNLRARSTRAHHVEGFTTEIPYFMNLADFFIGKPGPGSISEAVAMKLPVIVESNAWTLPQERYNARWITEQQVGEVLPNFRRIREAVEKMLKSLDRYRSAVSSIKNRAVFEIPGILARIANQPVL